MTIIGDTRTITITPEDVERGVPDSGEFCPVALAAKRQINTGADVTPPIMITWRAGSGSMFFVTEQRWELSTNLQVQINNFDAGGPFVPGDYQITLER